MRKAKACLHSKRFDEAIAALEGLPFDSEKTELEQCIRGNQESLYRTKDINAAQKRLVQELPRYKPSMYG